MPQIRKEAPVAPHKQGKLPAWEEVPVPDITSTVKKIDKAKKKQKKEREQDDCGCW